MTRTERLKRAVLRPSGGRWARLSLSDETRTRLAAAVLWSLVALAGLGGLVALVRPAPAPPDRRGSVDSPSSTVSEAWAAAGFGERAVAAYLTTGAGSDGDGFASFLEDVPATRNAASGDAPAVAAVTVDRAGESYWAVTVVAGEPGRESFWRVGVVSDGGRLVATGHPTPVAAPSVAEPPVLAVSSWETPPVDDALVETVTGWIGAYACGQGDVSRWLAPGVRLEPVTPPVCSTARLDRWGTQDDGEERRLVVTEAVLDSGASERRVAFALALARRDGRWEVAELLPAPPLSEEVER